MASKSKRDDLENDLGSACPGSTEFISIPPTAVGKLIGKGGSTIKSLQSQSGAVITVVNCQVTIKGEASNVKKAEKLVRDLVGHLALKTIKIGQSQVGLLIGTKGARIKSIQEQSGATVKVEQHPLHNNSDVVVQITGSKDQIRMAEDLIGTAISPAHPTTEMVIVTVSGSKLVLKQLPKGVHERDLLALYPDTHIRPNIVIRVEKGGTANYATLTFATKGEMDVWMHQLQGNFISGRRIVFKK